MSTTFSVSSSKKDPLAREKEEEEEDKEETKGGKEVKTKSPKQAAAQEHNDDDDEEEEDEEEESPQMIEDAPSELAVDRIVDIIDFEIEHILWERMNRKDHYDTLEWFWKWFPGREVDKGCRFIRRLVAHILTHSCACQPYGVTKPSDGNKNGGDNEQDANNDHDLEPLVQWDASQWQGFRDSFDLLRTLMLRRDALINYVHAQDVLDNGGEVAKDREQSPLFAKNFPLLMDQIDLHRILAPIRNALEGQTRKTSKQSIGKKKLQQVWTGIRRLDNDSSVKEALLALFDLSDDDTDDDTEESNEKQRVKRYKKLPSTAPGLKSLSELARILQNIPFDLVRFQNGVERNLHKCNFVVTGGQDCALFQARYAIPKDSALYQTLQPPLVARMAEMSARRRKEAKEVEESNLEELRQRSAALKSSKRHGDDPLEGAVQAAKKARKAKAQDTDEDYEDGSSSARRETKKKGGVKLSIMDEIEEEEEEDVAKLGSPPRRRARRSAVSFGGNHIIPPDKGIFDANGKVLKRLKWTDEEKTAVREGVRKFGVGKWKDIKAEYNAILRNRNAVQIKDCFRTMTKHDEV